MTDDLGLREELIAPAVVAVVVRIDQSLGGFTPDARVVFDQLACVRQIPEGVYHQPAAAIDKAGIAPA